MNSGRRERKLAIDLLASKCFIQIIVIATRGDDDCGYQDEDIGSSFDYCQSNREEYGEFSIN